MATVSVAYADPGDQPTLPVTTGASEAETPTGPTQWVRLITGDQVEMDSSSSVVSVKPGPRPDGSIPTFVTQINDDATYVIPNDVATLIGTKLDKDLFNVTELASYKLGPNDPVPVIVTTTGSSDPRSRSAGPDISAMGVDVTKTFTAISAQAGEADASTDSGPASTWALIDSLSMQSRSRSLPGTSVGMVYLDHQVNLDPSQSAITANETPQWMDAIGKTQAVEKYGVTGEGVKVAVIDTGIDTNHPDLAGKVVAAQDFTGSGSPEDGHGHGTFVASEIAGSGTGSKGLYAGVAPEADLISARVLDATGYGQDSWIMSGMEWAAQQGADIISMSLGTKGSYSAGTSPTDQLVNALSLEYGTLFVVAAGNSGAPMTIESPSAADLALSVGATSADGTTLTSFSSQGPRIDGAVKPEIVAPGDSIWGAGKGGTGYIKESGTSMATPLVAGAAALLLQSDSTLSREDLRALLMASASPMPAYSTMQVGAGLVNVYNAISQSVTTSPTQINFGSVEYPHTDIPSQSLTYTNTSNADEVLTLTSTITNQYGAGTDVPPEQQRSLSLSEDTITVPAHGSASVTATLDGSAWPDGVVGGRITATNATGQITTTPFGALLQQPLFAVTLTVKDFGGDLSDPQPDTDFDGTLISIDGQGAMYPVNPREWIDGSATVKVPEGKYVAVGNVQHSEDTNEKIAVVLSPVVDVTKPVTVTLDASQTKQVVVTTDKEAMDAYMSFLTTTLVDPSGSIRVRLDAYVSPESVFQPVQLFMSSVVATQDFSWRSIWDGLLVQPWVEAALDSNGVQRIAAEQAVSGDHVLSWPVGEHEYSLVNIASPLDDDFPRAKGVGKVALVHWEDSDPNDFSQVVEWTKAALDAGYVGLVIDSEAPNYTLLAAQNGYPALTIPVLVTATTDADVLRARIASGNSKLYILSHQAPDYAYRPFKIFDNGSGEPFLITMNEETTATLNVLTRSIGSTAGSVFIGTSAGSGADKASVAVGMPQGRKVTFYVLADPVNPTSVDAYFLADLTGWPETTFSSRPMILTSDDNIDIVMGAQAHTLGFASQAYNDARYSMIRKAESLETMFPAVIDGSGNPQVDWDGNTFPTTMTASLHDVTTDEDLVSYGGELSTIALSSSLTSNEDHTVRFETTQTIDAPVWGFSDQMSSAWQWTSRATSPEESSAQPWFTSWYELPNLDAANRGSNKQSIVMHISTPPGVDPIPITKVSLAASTNGGVKWTPVTMSLAKTLPTGSVGAIDGESLYVGTISAKVGSTVSIKSTVTGKNTSLEQKTMHAYKVTSSPVQPPAPVVWTPASPAPTITTATATSITGTAKSGQSVRATWPDGTTSTAVKVTSRGTWTIPVPAKVCGNVSVVALDSKGNESEPATATIACPVAIPVPTITSATTESVSGTGVPGLSIMLIWANKTGSAVLVQADGTWSAKVPYAVCGDVSVYALDAKGKQSEHASATIECPKWPDSDQSSVAVGTPVVSLPCGDVGASTTVTAIAKDWRGVPMPGVDVHFSATGSATLSASSVATNSSGYAETSLTSHGEGQVSVSASVLVDGVEKNVSGSGLTVQFINVCAKSAASVTAKVDTTASTATGGSAHLPSTSDPFVVIASLADSAGRPVIGADLTGFGIKGSTAVTVGLPTDLGDGTYSIPVTGKSSGKYSIQITYGKLKSATISLAFLTAKTKVSTVRVGHTLAVRGYGFQRGESVSVMVDGVAVPKETVKANSVGWATFIFTVPAGTQVGDHEVTVTGTTSGSMTIPFHVKK